MTVPSFQVRVFLEHNFFYIWDIWDISHHKNKTKTERRDNPSPTYGNTPEYSYLWTADSPTVTVYSDSSKEGSKFVIQTYGTCDSQVPYFCSSSLTLFVARYD